MAYHRHDPTGEHLGYQDEAGMPFFEKDEDKYNNAKYDAGDDPFEAGYKAREEEEQRKKDEKTEFERQLDEEQKPKYKDRLDDEAIKRKAAEEINKEMNSAPLKESRKKSKGSIEKAIEDAIKEEKEIIILDR